MIRTRRRRRRGPFAAEVGADPGSLRIGVLDHPASGVAGHPDGAEAVQSTGKLLESLGHRVEVAHPAAMDEPETSERFGVIVAAATGADVDYWEGVAGRPADRRRHRVEQPRPAAHRAKGLGAGVPGRRGGAAAVVPTRGRVVAPARRLARLRRAGDADPQRAAAADRLPHGAGEEDRAAPDHAAVHVAVQPHRASPPSACRCTGRRAGCPSACSSSGASPPRTCCCGWPVSSRRRSRGPTATRPCTDSGPRPCRRSARRAERAPIVRAQRVGAEEAPQLRGAGLLGQRGERGPLDVRPSAAARGRGAGAWAPAPPRRGGPWRRPSA